MPFGLNTLLLSLEGGLFAFGDNEEGQLGLGHKNSQLEPAEVPWNGPQPVQVDWGLQHWEAGRSRSSSSLLTFQRVSELSLITLVAAGEYHSAAIDTEGGLWVWTSKTDLSWACSLPQRVQSLPPIIKVAGGFNFLVAEAEEGLWVLGDNEEGQLGLGHTNSALQPTPLQVEGFSEGPVRCLAALYDGVILIDSQGGVFSSGKNFNGQLGRFSGDDTKLQRIMNIPPMLAASCGREHTLCLDENGGVWTWGCGSDGQLGTGDTPHQAQPTMVPSLKRMSALVAGRFHSLAFPQEGGLLVFGWNVYGQLGFSNRANQTIPVVCPVKPALPHSLIQSRKKSARFL